MKHGPCQGLKDVCVCVVKEYGTNPVLGSTTKSNNRWIGSGVVFT